MAAHKQRQASVFIPCPTFVYFISQSCRLLFQTIIFPTKNNPRNHNISIEYAQTAFFKPQTLHYGSESFHLWDSYGTCSLPEYNYTICKQRWWYGSSKFTRSLRFSSDAPTQEQEPHLIFFMTLLKALDFSGIVLVLWSYVSKHRHSCQDILPIERPKLTKLKISNLLIKPAIPKPIIIVFEKLSSIVIKHWNIVVQQKCQHKINLIIWYFYSVTSTMP